MENCANDFAKYMQVDLDKKLSPINNTIDNLMARLEEFEALIVLGQQEQGNSCGPTGSLTLAEECEPALRKLCERVDVLEKLVEDVKTNLDIVEDKLQAAEEAVGLTNGPKKIKNLLSPLFKQSPKSPSTEVPTFSTDKYFE